MKLNDKLKKLESILKGYDSILVALSGGVDSAFLLVFSTLSLGTDKVSAITACGPHLAADETEYAARLCRHLGVDHEPVNTDHILPLIAENHSDRCYLCKRELFSIFKECAEASGRVIADGTNLDDMEDFRPGHKALRELMIASPLKDAGMTKSDIRSALEALAEDNKDIAQALTLDNGMPMWEKPAFACLASRIPYDEPITKEKLLSVYEAEVFLRRLGLTQVRLRHHGDTARIEVPPEDRHFFFDEDLMDQIDMKIKALGFKYVVLDLGGYKMGGGYHDGKNSI